MVTKRPNWFSKDKNVKQSSLSFHRPNWFEPVSDECLNLQSNVGLADLSPFSKFSVSGPDASQFIEHLGSNKMPVIGRVGLNACINRKRRSY